MRHDTYEEMHRILKDVILADPNVSQAEAKETTWALFKKRDTFYRLLFDNWFNANWDRYDSEVKDNQVVVKRKTRGSTKKSPRFKVIAKRVLKESAAIVLMNLPMPNGKNLRDCTGSECAKFGGWFASIAKVLKPNEKVGSHLSEQDLKNLYGRNVPQRGAVA